MGTCLPVPDTAAGVYIPSRHQKATPQPRHPSFWLPLTKEPLVGMYEAKANQSEVDRGSTSKHKVSRRRSLGYSTKAFGPYL